MLTALFVFLPLFSSLPVWQFFLFPFFFRHYLLSPASSFPSHLPSLSPAYISCVVCSHRGDWRTPHHPHSAGTPLLSVSLFHREAWQLHTWPQAKVDNSKRDQSRRGKHRHMHFISFNFSIYDSHTYTSSLTLAWHSWIRLVSRWHQMFKAITCFFCFVCFILHMIY